MSVTSTDGEDAGLSGVTVSQMRSLASHCWGWGAVTIYRECGGVGYPAMGELSSQRYRPIGGLGIANIGTLFCNVEKTLDGQPMQLKMLVYYRYAKPYVVPGMGRSLPDFVEYTWGDMPPNQAKVLARILGGVHRRWYRYAANLLF